MATKGTGLNSIPNRFALMSAVLSALSVTAVFLVHGELGLNALSLAVIAAAIGLPALVTLTAARMLKRQIEALRAGTEAIVSGDFNAPLEVDCACEVGGLADSFARMVERFNSNILRMNILAYTDAVTGLPNRAVVFHVLDQITRQSGEGSAAVLFIDLDGFKRINDQLGHEVGDTVLREVSRRIAAGMARSVDELQSCTTPLGELCDAVPDGPVLARVAGDEFVAILPGLSDCEAAEAISESILDALARPVPVGDAIVKLSASVGVAHYPHDGQTPEELLTIADLAMYEAKSAGRNRAVLTSPRLHALWKERRAIQGALPKALEAGDLRLDFQPRFDAQTLKMVSAEGLARWTHPKLGDIAPSTFVPIAEQTGLVPQLGAAMFELAAETAASWAGAGFCLGVSVNVSPAEFNDARLAHRLLAVLDRHKVSPQAIELEITESMAMSAFEATQDQMLILCEAGFRIAVDDFGTGYSNFAQLARLPFSAVKLDQSLVAQVDRDDRARTVVGGMIDMARHLGLTTVAEGVERQPQLEALQALGCDEVQGFLLARPMPRERLAGFRPEQGFKRAS